MPRDLVSSSTRSHYYDKRTKRPAFNQTTKSLPEIEKLIHLNRCQLLPSDRYCLLRH